MDLIDRYVYAVTKRLSEFTRHDVEQELRANIQDMLPEDYDQGDVKVVLAKLGNPYLLAEEYRETKRYLIGPSMYESYIATLRLVIGIVVSVVAILTTLDAILGGPAAVGTLPDLVAIIVRIFSEAINAGAQSALWVTFVFAILERSKLVDGQLPFSKKDWALDDLPPVPKQTSRRIPKSEAILAMFGTISGTALFALTPDLIAWYEQENGRLVLAASLFNEQVVRSFLPFILVLAATGLFVAGFKLIHGRWSLALAVGNAIHNTLFSIFLVAAFGNQRLFSSAFLAKAQAALGMETAQFNAGWSQAIWAIIALSVVAAVFDSLAGFWKSLQREGERFGADSIRARLQKKI